MAMAAWLAKRDMTGISSSQKPPALFTTSSTPMTPPLTCRGTASSAVKIRGPLVDPRPFQEGRVIQQHRRTLTHDLACQRIIQRHGFDAANGLPKRCLTSNQA